MAPAPTYSYPDDNLNRPPGPTTLEERFRVSREESERLQSQVLAVNEELEKVANRIAIAETRNNELVEQIEQTEEASVETHNLLIEIDRLNQEIDRLRAERNTYKEMAEKLQRDLARFGQYNVLPGEGTELQAARRALAERTDQIKILNLRIDGPAGYKFEISTLKAQFRDPNGSHARIRGQLIDLQEDLRIATEEADMYKKHNTIHAREFTSIRDEIDELLTDRDNVTRERDALQTRVNTLVSQMQGRVGSENPMDMAQNAPINLLDLPPPTASRISNSAIRTSNQPNKFRDWVADIDAQTQVVLGLNSEQLNSVLQNTNYSSGSSSFVDETFSTPGHRTVRSLLHLFSLDTQAPGQITNDQATFDGPSQEDDAGEVVTEYAHNKNHAYASQEQETTVEVAQEGQALGIIPPVEIPTGGAKENSPIQHAVGVTGADNEQPPPPIEDGCPEQLRQARAERDAASLERYSFLNQRNVAYAMAAGLRRNVENLTTERDEAIEASLRAARDLSDMTTQRDTAQDQRRQAIRKLAERTAERNGIKQRNQLLEAEAAAQAGMRATVLTAVRTLTREPIVEGQVPYTLDDLLTRLGRVAEESDLRRTNDAEYIRQQGVHLDEAIALATTLQDSNSELEDQATRLDQQLRESEASFTAEIAEINGTYYDLDYDVTTLITQRDNIQTALISAINRLEVAEDLCRRQAAEIATHSAFLEEMAQNSGFQNEDIATAERRTESAILERDAIEMERDFLVRERDMANQSWSILTSERDIAITELRSVTAERDDAVASLAVKTYEINVANRRLDELRAQVHEVEGLLKTMTGERDALIAVRNNLRAEVIRLGGEVVRLDGGVAGEDGLVQSEDGWSNSPPDDRFRIERPGRSSSSPGDHSGTCRSKGKGPAVEGAVGGVTIYQAGSVDKNRNQNQGPAPTQGGITGVESPIASPSADAQRIDDSPLREIKIELVDEDGIYDASVDGNDPVGRGVEPSPHSLSPPTPRRTARSTRNQSPCYTPKSKKRKQMDDGEGEGQPQRKKRG